METHKIRRSSAVALLIELGFPNAVRYSRQRLRDRLLSLQDLIQDGRTRELKETKNIKLFQFALAVGAKEHDIEITED